MKHPQQIMAIALAMASAACLTVAILQAPVILFALGSLPGPQALAVCVWILAGPCAFLLIACMSLTWPTAMTRASMFCLLALLPALLVLTHASRPMIPLACVATMGLHLLLMVLSHRA